MSADMSVLVPLVDRIIMWTGLLVVYRTCIIRTGQLFTPSLSSLQRRSCSCQDPVLTHTQVLALLLDLATLRSVAA